MPYMTQKPEYREWYFGGPKQFSELLANCSKPLSCDQKQALESWLKIAIQNPVLIRAYNPPITEASISFCGDNHDLALRIVTIDDLPPGTGFALDDICFLYLGLPALGGDWLPIVGEKVEQTFLARLPGESLDDSIKRVYQHIVYLQKNLKAT